MQQLITIAIFVVVCAALVVALEVIRKVEEARTPNHPSSFPEQSSCVRIFRDPRPFDYEMDS